MTKRKKPIVLTFKQSIALVDFIKRRQNDNKPGIMIAIDVRNLTDEQRRELTYLSLAFSLSGQKCVKCGYEWNPSSKTSKKLKIPNYDGYGKPFWRKIHDMNPAYPDGENKYICSRCLDVPKYQEVVEGKS